ncbi:glycosyltransferase family 9 protein [Niastella caeni]|uniref:Glycosyltransferase family 9 protein n=1 Tax=Niastella caeni TaxID=2569763 RepID=A0A4V4H1T8_9BACT|nr:glycosyltransferase family 9 protein [Niastella caeni]THU41726.1 glycosyltransferase family 9 protein [Niastella caeni]
MKSIPRNIIISRTDSIGDVILTLPVAAVLKKHFPTMTIGFMGKSYTRPVIEACKYVDEFIDVDTFFSKKVLVSGEAPECILHVFPTSRIAKRARKMGIPLRIGTTNRLYHWFTCNKLVKLSRKKSDLHEAQLNLALLRPFGINETYSLQQISTYFGLEKLQPLPSQFAGQIQKEKYNLILHPKSQGSGREWPLENFFQLIQMLDPNKFNIFISGTAKEKERMQWLFDKAGNLVTDITGKMSLNEFIAFIKQCDGLVASGTGPLHIAAALGKDALGIFPPIRPIHPGRWAPLGKNAQVFVLDKQCVECKGNKVPCSCIINVPVALLKETLDKKYLDKMSNK